MFTEKRKYGLKRQKRESRPHFRADGRIWNKKIRPKTTKTRIQAAFPRRRTDLERENTA